MQSDAVIDATVSEPAAVRLKRNIVSLLRRPAVRSIVIPPLRSYFRYFPLQAGKLSVWNRVVSHLWWLESRVPAKTAFGSTLEVDPRDGCGRYIYYFALWEPNLTAFITNCLRPGDCFIDVGANVGYFSLLGSTLVGERGKVVAIEAVPRTFDVLAANVARNSAANVRALPLAVWDKHESLTFFVSADTIDSTSTAIASLGQARGLTEECVVQAAPLASLLSPEEIATARLIKIDVEGAERQAIVGVAPVLENGREDLEVIIEIASEAFDEIASFFRERGFHSYHLDNNYDPAVYIQGTGRSVPTRVEIAPPGHTYLDLIFSRKDSATLR